MKGLRILVSAVGGDIGAAVACSLLEAGAGVIGCDMRDCSPIRDRLAAFHVAPPASDAESYMNFLARIVRDEGIGCFTPVSEPELRLLNTRREDLNRLDVKVCINNRHILDTFLDKLATARYLASIGIRAPRTVPLDEYDGSFGFPLVVKSRSSSGSRSLRVVEDEVDLDYVRHKDAGDLIAQQQIGSTDEEYTTGVFSDGQTVSTITFRRRLGFGGISIEAVLADHPAMDELARKVARATGLVGSINIQTRRVGQAFWPFEINPRLSSTVLFRKRFGFDDAAWWVDVLRGRGYRYHRLYKAGRALRTLSERYVDMEKS